ncbi:unnamed protein product [Durusdinium trenchii]|uniref:Uncharacterized protein n=1 Tax=Durusdinium trenchii TaxID=1381693 RepID=A0ABP0JBJ4_9DINO
MSKYLSTPGVADKIPSINGPVLKAVPPNSRKGFYLQPWHLNFSENAKCGKFPSNVAMRLHLPSFLNRGFEGDREPLEVRFDQPDLELFSVMYVDGHTKGVCIQAIFGLLAHCAVEPHEVEEDPQFCAVVALLDAELKMHCKSASSEFDYKKLSFILEARGVLQEQQIERAQSRIQPAFRQSITAGFNLSLEADQVAHRRAGIEAEADADSSGALSAKLEPWLQSTLGGLNQGIRRSDNESIIGYVNYVAAGVVSSFKQHFALQQVTGLCHSNPRTFLAVLVLPNRAGDLRSTAKSEKAEHDDSEDEEQAKTEGDEGRCLAVSEMIKLPKGDAKYGGDGKKWAVASVAHSGCETLFCANLVAHRMYGLARSGDLKIAGFPRFEEAISGLKGMQSMQAPSYEVCVTLSDGTLIIKQLVLDMWTQKHPDFSAECTELLTAHNSEFNPKNIQSGGEVQEGTTTVELPSKQLCVQGTKSKSDFEKEHADRLSLSCGGMQLHWCKEAGCLFVTCEKDTHASAWLEMFSFGSGDFLRGTEAHDVMSDGTSSGRWIPYNMSGPVMTLQQLLQAFENQGTVNITLLEHTIKKDDANAVSIDCNAKICFALDPPKDRKRQKASTGNALTFGSKMDLAKLRTAKNLVVAWRLKLFGCASSIRLAHVFSLPWH